MGYAASIWILFVGRLIGGMTAATHSTAMAYMADISKNDEKKLDTYEDYPIVYKKYYFKYYGKKVMTYTMTKKTIFTYPSKRYLNIIKKGYKDCNLDKKYLTRALKF